MKFFVAMSAPHFMSHCEADTFPQNVSHDTPNRSDTLVPQLFTVHTFLHKHTTNVYSIKAVLSLIVIRKRNKTHTHTYDKPVLVLCLKKLGPVVKYITRTVTRDTC